MIILGLTGSIGTGKSTVAQWLKELTIPVYEADSVVHNLFLNDQPLIKEVGLLFPDSLISEKIDRKKLASIALSHSESLKKLEAIVHPRVHQTQKTFLDFHKAMATPLVVLEVPLLYEKGYEAICDYVIVMTCLTETQKYRALLRSDMTEEHFTTIRLNQLPDHEKIRRAHYTLNSEESKDEVFRKLQFILNEIKY
jgi:dephospho-CoA kinase